MNLSYSELVTSSTIGVLTNHTPGITFHGGGTKEVLRITPDGRMILGEGLSQDEATQAAAKALVALFEQQFEAARKDSERLDWLERNVQEVGFERMNERVLGGCSFDRSAIDAAMEAIK